MRVVKGFALVVGISIFFVALAFFASFFTGAGHGSYFFLAIIGAPFSVFETAAPMGLIFWPGVGILFALRRFIVCRIVAKGSLIIHYIGIIMVCFQTEWTYVYKAWRALPELVIAFVLLYLGSQIFMWWLLSRKNPISRGKISTTI